VYNVNKLPPIFAQRQLQKYTEKQVHVKFRLQRQYRNRQNNVSTFETESHAVSRSSWFGAAMIAWSGQCLELVHGWPWSCSRH